MDRSFPMVDSDRVPTACRPTESLDSALMGTENSERDTNDRPTSRRHAPPSAETKSRHI